MAKEWDIKRTTFSVGDFLSWQRSLSLELSPSFQRRPVWTKAQKSYLIDTVYRGLPVPIIFLRERTDVKTLSTIREVVDGQQRLRTLLGFVDLSCLSDPDERDEFVVQKKHNAEIEKKRFEDLSGGAKKRILSYQFSVHVLPSDTSDADVLSIFARMNSTGSSLNAQELRNAEYFGYFKNLSYNLAHKQLSRWRKWSIFSEQEIARMSEVELTSEFLIFLLDGMFERNKGSIDKYYANYDENFSERKRIEKEFQDCMNQIDDSFGDSITETVFQNRNMFFHLFVTFVRLGKAGLKVTRKRKNKILEIGDRFAERRDLPRDVGVALEVRFNRLSNRNIISNFLFDNVSQ